MGEGGSNLITHYCILHTAILFESKLNSVSEFRMDALINCAKQPILMHLHLLGLNDYKRLNGYNQRFKSGSISDSSLCTQNPVYKGCLVICRFVSEGS